MTNTFLEALTIKKANTTKELELLGNLIALYEECEIVECVNITTRLNDVSKSLDGYQSKILMAITNNNYKDFCFYTDLAVKLWTRKRELEWSLSNLKSKDIK